MRRVKYFNLLIKEPKHECCTGDLLVSSVSIATDPRNTRFAGELELDFATLFLPNIRGFNTLEDLFIGMSLDSGLLVQVRELAVQPIADVFENLTVFQNDFTNMMFKWAGVENIDPASRGVFISDARILAFMEEYFGEGFFQARFPEANPLSLAAVAMENVFEILQSSMIAKFIFQSGGDELFITQGSYDLAADSIVFDIGEAMLDGSALAELGIEGAASSDALVFWAGVASFIDEIRGGLEGFTQAELDVLNEAVALSDPSLTWDAVAAASNDTGAVTLTGGEENDFLAGGSGNDTLTGNGGDDTLLGNDGQDILDGGDGNDILRGGDGFDHLIGGDGNDILYDGLGSDLLEGGLGDDIYNWETGLQDFIFDAGGFDVIRTEFAQFIQFERVFSDDLLLRISEDPDSEIASRITLQDQLADPSLGLPVISILIVKENCPSVTPVNCLNISISPGEYSSDSTSVLPPSNASL